MTGKRYFAFTGKGMNMKKSSALGNNIANAVTTPKIAPEAPTMGVESKLKRCCSAPESEL